MVHSTDKKYRRHPYKGAHHKYQSYQTDKSVVAARILEQGHRTEDAKLFKYKKNFSELTFWKRLFTQKYQLMAINLQIPSGKKIDLQIYRTYHHEILLTITKHNSGYQRYAENSP